MLKDFFFPFLNIEKISRVHIFLDFKDSLFINKRNISIFKVNKKRNVLPKISIVSPIFNRERYLLRFIKNIQNQNFKEIEIIFVDDYSLDSSIKIIEECAKNDKRVILLKNKINKGTFISRNLGVLYSKGEYIVLCDPDDMLSKNILNICFKYAKKYNFEMIRYATLSKRRNNDLIIKIKNKYKPINKNKLKLYLFYRNNDLKAFEFAIWNKFIKKSVYIKSLNSIKKLALSLFMTYLEDFFFIYFLFKEANSFIILNNVGYYYIKSSVGITKSLANKSILLMKFKLGIIKYFFENTKNNKYEKDIINLLLLIFFRDLNQLLKKANYYYYYFYSFLNSNITNMYLNSKFINKENKIVFQKIKNNIEKLYQNITEYKNKKLN